MGGRRTSACRVVATPSASMFSASRDSKFPIPQCQLSAQFEQTQAMWQNVHAKTHQPLGRNDDTAVEPLIKNDAFEGNEYEIITYFRRITTTTQRKNSALH